MSRSRSRKKGGAALMDRKRGRGNGGSGGRQAKLTITNGCFSGLEIVLRKPRTMLGRALSCDVCLDHSFVSNQHAIISRTDDGYLLEDLNSAHGTTVNGREIHRHRLRRNDTIGIGTFDLRFTG